MQFTVIIPAYNAAAFIQEAVDSVMSQKYQSWELIVVDDGSRDDTKRIAEGFAAADPRVRLISKKNAGVSAARNDGLVCACGDYVFFLDADDRLEENVMSRAADQLALLDYRPDIVFGEYDRFDEYTGTGRHCTFDFGSDLCGVYGLGIWNILFGKEPMFLAPIAAQLYRTAFLQNSHILFDPRLFISEDHDWRYAALAKSERYWFAPFSFFTYYNRKIGPPSVTHRPVRFRTVENSHLYLLKWYEAASSDGALAPVKAVILGRVAEDYANKATDISAIQDRQERRQARRLFLQDAGLLKYARFRRYRLSNAVLRIFGIRIYLFSIRTANWSRHRVR